MEVSWPSSRYRQACPSQAPTLCPGFLQLGELCPGLFENRNIGVGIFPEREEVVISRPCLGPFSSLCQCPSQFQARPRPDRVGEQAARSIKNLLKFGGGFGRPI